MLNLVSGIVVSLNMNFSPMEGRIWVGGGEAIQGKKGGYYRNPSYLRTVTLHKMYC